jgi:predicted MFS family arabinose efflux permease
MQTVLLLLLSRHLGLGAAGYGYVLAGLGVGGILGTMAAGRAAASSRPGAVLAGALLVLAVPSSLMAVTPWLPGLLLLSVVGGAGAVLVEVLCETALQRDLPDEVFARAYGIALPASIAGIAVGSLVAAPLVAVVGLTGAIVVTGGLAGGYAGLVVLPRRIPGRHRAPRRIAAAPATV